MTRDNTITVARTVGMVFIVLCHLFGYGPISSLSFLSEVFNVGTSLFLFISGFLYGKKSIEKVPSWYFARYKRICFPMYIWVVIVFIYRFFCVTHTAEPIKYLLYALNLQGLPFVFNKLEYSVFSIIDTDQLWFLTVIMLCYLIVPLLSKIKPWFTEKSTAVKALIIAAFLILQSGLAFVGININYFLIFTTGYFVSAIWKRKLSGGKFAIMSAICAAALAFRFLCAVYFQSGTAYTGIIVPITQDIFAVWIYLAIFKISENLSKPFNSIAQSKAMKYIDELSFYIYMTHFIFIAGSLRTLNITSSVALNILITLVLIIISAVILNLLCRFILNRKPKKV